MTCAICRRQARGFGWFDPTFGFSVAGGRIRGHVDGIVAGGPPNLPMTSPALWECKSLNAKSWSETARRGVAASKPLYAAQIAIYQAYMEATVPGISDNPALFTAINKDTAELHHELVPFDAALAQRLSDRAVNILRATEAHELLPRIATSPDHFECQRCPCRRPGPARVGHRQPLRRRRPVNGPELLEHAAGLVARRRREYGEPVDVFEAVAKRWSLVFGTKVTAAQVVIALLDLKLTRLSRDPKHLDSIVDVAGYAAVLREVGR